MTEVIYKLVRTGHGRQLTPIRVGEVVRCKDCKYGYQFYDVQKGITDSWVECRNPNGLNHDAPEDGYCYCGERKDDE